LRSDITPAELRLWRHLTRIETRDTHFRRQVPIGLYVVDFACLRARLVIEVDGEHDGHKRQASHDEARARWLESQGFRVLRFWNGDVLGDIENVLDAIHAALYGHVFAEPHAFSRRRTKPTSAATPHSTEGSIVSREARLDMPGRMLMPSNAQGSSG